MDEPYPSTEPTSEPAATDAPGVHGGRLTDPPIGAESEPAAPRRLWRGGHLNGHRAGTRRKIARVLLAVLVLAIGLFMVLSWFSPVAPPELLPMWATRYRSPSMPAIAQADHDRRAFTTRLPMTRPSSLASRPDGGYLTMVEEVAALAGRPTGESLVVYIRAEARVVSSEGGSDGVEKSPVLWILPDEAEPDASRRLGWIPLQSILTAVRNHGDRHKLLILDLRESSNDPRMGRVADDAEGALREEIQRVPDDQMMVLVSCAPGEPSLTSEVMGRSVFCYYLEEGLRGWADSDPTDGRVTVKELAAFVRHRVSRWADRNRGMHQRPYLMNPDGPDFPLVVLPKGKPRPHLTLPKPKSRPVYPKWLIEGWARRDRWRTDGRDRIAPRLFSQLEAALLRAESNWRGGYDAENEREELTEEIERLEDRVVQLREIPHPRSASLAMEAAFGRTPSRIVAGKVGELLAKWSAPEPDQPPDQARLAEAARIAEFHAGLGEATDFDVASAVFSEALKDQGFSSEKIQFLDRLLKARQPQPLYAETLALSRVAASAGDTWRPSTARLLLDVVRRGELAVADASSFPLVRPLLDEADQIRHESEVLFEARGFCSLEETDRRLQEADTALASVLEFEAAIDSARRGLGGAAVLLPTFAVYLDREPKLELDWEETAQGAEAVANLLASAPPDDPEEVRDRLIQLTGRTEALKRQLSDLSRPFSAERIASLTGPDVPPGPETVRALDDLLSVAIPSARQRAALWTTKDRLALRLAEETMSRDVADGQVVPATENLRAGSIARLANQEYRGVSRRAGVSIDLLGIGGVAEGKVKGLRELLNTFKAQQKDPRMAGDTRIVAPLAHAMDRAWSDLPARLSEMDRADQLAGAARPVGVYDESNLMARARLGLIIAPSMTAPVLDDPTRNPIRLLHVERFEALRAWLADRYAFQSRDLGGSTFDQAAAHEYQQLGSRPERDSLTMMVSTGHVRLTSEYPEATVRLRFRLDGGTGPQEESVRIEVLTPERGWLEVGRGLPGPSDRGEGPLVLEHHLSSVDDSSLEVPLVVRMRAGPEPDGRPPLGFLVRVRRRERTYHAKVPVEIVPDSRQVRIGLGGDPARLSPPPDDLRLRPIGVPVPYYLHVENPSEVERKLVVQLRDDRGILDKGVAEFSIKAGTTMPVVLGPPGEKPETDTVDLDGPLVMRLLDADDPASIVAEEAVSVGAATPTDYVRVVSARFEPAGPMNDGRANLTVHVRAVEPVVGPPIAVELVLPPDRIPGLLSSGDGTLRTELKKEGDEAVLTAENLRFDEVSDEEGLAYLSIDGVERAMVFRVTYARRGEPTTPRRMGAPSVRLGVGSAANANEPLEIKLELDNPPIGGRLVVEVGRYLPNGFEADVSDERSARRQVVTLNPRGPAGALMFQTRVADPQVSLDVSRIRGRRTVRARLLDEEDQIQSRDERSIVLDDRPPATVRLVGMPKYAKSGAALTVKAEGKVPGSGLKRVAFFLGRPVDGKAPPGLPTIEARPLDVGRTVWAAELPIPEGRQGRVEISVEFVSGVGLSAFDTASVEVVAQVPVEPGSIEGKVVEGTRPQPGLPVALQDAKGGTLLQTKTGDDGTFSFARVPPGAYQVVSVKSTPPTRGSASVEVQPGQAVKKTVEMFRVIR